MGGPVPPCPPGGPKGPRATFAASVEPAVLLDRRFRGTGASVEPALPWNRRFRGTGASVEPALPWNRRFRGTGGSVRATAAYRTQIPVITKTLPLFFRVKVFVIMKNRGFVRVRREPSAHQGFRVALERAAPGIRQVRAAVAAITRPARGRQAPPAARYYGRYHSRARSAPGVPGGRPPGLAQRSRGSSPGEIPPVPPGVILLWPALIDPQG
jgi:hypothetical protein